MDFDLIWNAYPEDYNPCRRDTGEPSFSNQCAIRFAIALADGGINLDSFPGVHCWFGHGRDHCLRGEELAVWMKSKPEVFGPTLIKSEADASDYFGMRGLMFCRNFWGPGNQGDHIDIWNKDYMKTGNPGYISRSKEVWFWEIDASRFGEDAISPYEVKSKIGAFD